MATWRLIEKCPKCGEILNTQTGLTDELRNAIILALSEHPANIEWVWITEKEVGNEKE
jgi:hypothetical protein